MCIMSPMRAHSKNLKKMMRRKRMENLITHLVSNVNIVHGICWRAYHIDGCLSPLFFLLCFFGSYMLKMNSKRHKINTYSYPFIRGAVCVYKVQCVHCIVYHRISPYSHMLIPNTIHIWLRSFRKDEEETEQRTREETQWTNKRKTSRKTWKISHFFLFFFVVFFCLFRSMICRIAHIFLMLGIYF